MDGRRNIRFPIARHEPGGGRASGGTSVRRGSASRKAAPRIPPSSGCTIPPLVGSALLIRTFVNLRRIAPGFETRHVLTFQISPTGSAYNTTAKVGDFYRRALERLDGLPGVEAAAVTSNLPLSATRCWEEFHSTRIPSILMTSRSRLSSGRVSNRSAFSPAARAGIPRLPAST